MIYQGFRLCCAGRRLWYGVKDGKVTGNYDSQAALCEAIRMGRVRLTPLPEKA